MIQTSTVTWTAFHYPVRRPSVTATTFVMMLSIVNSVTKALRPPAPPEHIRSKEPPNSGLRPTPKRASPVSVLDLGLPTPAEINLPSPYPSSTWRHHRRWNRKSIAASASSTSPIGTPATDASDDRRASSTRHIVPTIDDSDAHFTIHGKDSDYNPGTWELDDDYALTLMDILHDILDSEERGEESPPPAAPPPWPPPQVRPPDTLAPTWKNDAPGSPTSDYSTEETGIPSSAAPPATGTLSVQLNLQHSDAVDPPGLIRDATSSTLNKSSLAVNPRTLSSPARRASQDSSTPAASAILPRSRSPTSDYSTEETGIAASERFLADPSFFAFWWFMHLSDVEKGQKRGVPFAGTLFAKPISMNSHLDSIG